MSEKYPYRIYELISLLQAIDLNYKKLQHLMTNEDLENFAYQADLFTYASKVKILLEDINYTLKYQLYELTESK